VAAVTVPDKSAEEHADLRTDLLEMLDGIGGRSGI
jgi:hypothetical protein